MLLRFGPFQLDTELGELRKSGLALRLPHQPMRLLTMLVRRAGDVVTREEIQQELWGSDTHVDFEQGINAAIRQIRHHLGDNAEAPRYLKTLPRRGYVWIAPVEAPEVVPEIVAEEPERAAPPRRRSAAAFVAVGLALVIATAAVTWMLVPRNRRAVAVTPFRAIGALPPGVDPRVFTEELRATVGMLPREHLLLLDERAAGEAQVRMEGTIQRVGDTVRVIVSAIDTTSHTQLWSETYERRIGEHQNMGMQTAHLVAHEVTRRFLPPPRREPRLRTQVPPEVLEVYRRARVERLRSLPDPAGNRVAAMFEQALEGKPQFAEALSGLADVWVQRSTTTGPPRRTEAVAKVRDYATRALAMQPDNPEAQSALGLIALHYDWDLSVAEQAFRQAIADDPEYVDAHYNLCAVLSARGEVDAAIEQYERARALDPIDFDLHPAEGMLYLRGRRYEEAVAKYREILRFRDSVQARWGIVWASSKRRDWNEATAMLRSMLDLTPRATGVPATEEEFRELFARAETLVLAARERGAFDHYHLAAYYSERGERDLALTSLQRAVAERSPGIAFVMVDPRFDALRDDPRYKPIVARIR